MTEYHLPQYYHASSSRENEDLYALKAIKVFGCFTQHLWRESRTSNDRPIYRNKLTKLHSSLLTFSATPLQMEHRAFIDFNSHLNNVVDTYTQHQAFLLPNSSVKTWDWKLS